MKQVTIEPTFASWRTKARALLVAGVPPAGTFWCDGEGESSDLFPELLLDESAKSESIAPLQIPRSFLELAEAVACHRDSSRWGILYRIVWRLTRGGERDLVERATDSDMDRANAFAREVHRDCQKMRAFVKFRKVGENHETRREQFLAWFEPVHDIVKYNAPFFKKRYPGMDWTIETPGESVHWDGVKLAFSEGVEKRDRSGDLNLRGQGRVDDVALVSEAVAESGSLKDVAEAAASCREFSLWEEASRTVFGCGNESAAMMLIGDQPDDASDSSGTPFVGPSGELLDDLLDEAGLKRDELYLTNAVKHFKWKAGGKRRLREELDAHEMVACRPSLLREIAKVNPQVVVTVGRSAAHAVIGSNFKITTERGLVEGGNQIDFQGPIVATIHPSFLLQLEDGSERERHTRKMIEELRLARSLAGKVPGRMKVKY